MSGPTVRKLLRHTDLLAAVSVVMVVTMLVVPLPAMLLDLLITINISAALTIVAATMYLGRALDFSSFPSLLLLTTMFRLAINVSVTRLILTTGDAGSVVKSFGAFVVGGNVVVGLVIFLILIVIQFVVVTNGAGQGGRGGRAIHPRRDARQADGDRRGPQRGPDQRRSGTGHAARRSSREADFYGAMDGASKFVKGDAMAAVIITAINLIGGIIVGMLQHHLGFTEATQHYSLLTVGDGLAAQIPALLISVATGIIVTRAASDRDLGSDIAGADPRPAQSAPRGRRGDRRLRADPGPAQAPLPVHRGDLRRDRLGGAQRDAGLPPRRPASSDAAGRAARGRRGAARRGRGGRAGARDRLRPRSARRRRAGRARCCAA